MKRDLTGRPTLPLIAGDGQQDRGEELRLANITDAGADLQDHDSQGQDNQGQGEQEGQR